MCVQFWSPVIYLSDIEMFFISGFILRAGYRVWLFKILLYNWNNENIYVHARYLLYYHADSYIFCSISHSLFLKLSVT